jgi:RNA polymerase sigma-70 factor (ECF subfamily)
LTQLLASDVRIVTDGGGKEAAALEGARQHGGGHEIQGADRALLFLVGAARKRPGTLWREYVRFRFATVNGLPGIIVEAPEGPVQTAAFEIEGDLIRALYVVHNPDKLRHLACGPAVASRALDRSAQMTFHFLRVADDSLRMLRSWRIVLKQAA